MEVHLYYIAVARVKVSEHPGSSVLSMYPDHRNTPDHSSMKQWELTLGPSLSNIKQDTFSFLG
jgi:hypothetical protein